MARKEKIVTFQDRDQSLTFKIREMPASKLERWMIKALLVIASSGATVPEGSDLSAAGAYLSENGLAALGNIDFDKAEPLLDELLSCCSRVVENVEELCTQATVDNYILDVTTLFKLRVEAIKLNLGFLGPEGGENLFGLDENGNTNNQ